MANAKTILAEQIVVWVVFFSRQSEELPGFRGVLIFFLDQDPAASLLRLRCPFQLSVNSAMFKPNFKT